MQGLWGPQSLDLKTNAITDCAREAVVVSLTLVYTIFTGGNAGEVLLLYFTSNGFCHLVG